MKKYFYLLFLVLASCVYTSIISEETTPAQNSTIPKNECLVESTHIDTLNQMLLAKDMKIDSLNNTIDGLLINIDSLTIALEIANSRISVNPDFQIPDSIVFADQLFNLKNERILSKFTDIYQKELKAAQKYIPRSGKYFGLIDTIFTKYKIPLDAKYLAIAESRLNPMATSGVGAAGVWQFMPKTGKGYGMKNNSFIDERRNIIKSTESAAKYLKNSYEFLKQRNIDDWLLSFSAYNAGVGSVSRICQKQGAKNFFDTILRVDETNKYVWRAVAIKMIFEHEKEIFGQEFEREKPLFSTVRTEKLHLNGYYKIDEWAKYQGTSVGKIWELNPWIKIHKRKRRRYSAVNDVVLPPGNYEILLPKKAIINQKEITRIEKKFLSKNNGYYTTHRVKKGDSLYKIARKYKTTVAKIKRINNLRSNVIYPGQKLKLYGTAPTRVYIVKRGDSISKIAKKLGVSTKKLIKKNKLRAKNGIVMIYPKQKIYY